MLSEVMAHYGLAQPFYDAGWFETEHHRQVARTLAWAVAHRRLIAMAGLVGSGKTAFLRRVQDDLTREGKVLISKSFRSRRTASGCRRSSPRCSTTSPPTASPGSPASRSGASGSFAT